MVNEIVTNVTLTSDDPQEVRFAGAYPYYWVENFTSDYVYVRIGKNPTPEADGTYTIPAGDKRCISGVGGIYLLGNGKVQISASTNKECPFKSASAGGGDIKINGIAAINGAMQLTQSLIPSDGVAYQMPFYVQSGTMTVGKSALDGIDITFPRAFTAAPLVIFGASVNPSYAKYPTAASYNNLTNEGFTLIASRVGSSGASTIPDAAPCVVNWVALGQLEV